MPPPYGIAFVLAGVGGAFYHLSDLARLSFAHNGCRFV